MKLTIVSEDLKKALATAGRAVESRPTLPVLSHVLLDADADRGELTLAGCNLERYVRRNSMANVEDGGSLTVPWRLFNDLVATFPDGEQVSLSVHDMDDLLVQCGKVEANLRGIDAQEFPTPPRVLAEGDKLAEFAPADLLEWLTQVTFAAADDESRPTLTGVFVESKKGELSFVTADGFRLAWRHGETDLADGSFILPGNAADALVKLLTAQLRDGREAVVSLFLDKNQTSAHFRLYDVDLVTQLIEGKYVNYTQIVPTKWDTRAVVARRELTRLVNTAGLYVRRAANVIHLELSGPTQGEGVLKITAEDAELGAFESTVETEHEGEPVIIAFNVVYLLDALGACGTAQVALELNGSGRPGVVKPVGDDDYLCVIMPMHMRE